MKFLDAETAVALNRMTVRLHGGMFLPPDNLRPGQALGFMEQVRVNRLFGQVLYPSPYHQAAAYLYYIAKSHPFHDGNKRTGLACALTFLEWNGLRYGKIDIRAGEAFIISVAVSRRDPGREIDRIARWLRPRAVGPAARRSGRRRPRSGRGNP